MPYLSQVLLVLLGGLLCAAVGATRNSGWFGGLNELGSYLHARFAGKTVRLSRAPIRLTLMRKTLKTIVLTTCASTAGLFVAFTSEGVVSAQEPVVGQAAGASPSLPVPSQPASRAPQKPQLLRLQRLQW